MPLLDDPHSQQIANSYTGIKTQLIWPLLWKALPAPWGSLLWVPTLTHSATAALQGQPGHR